MDAQRLARRQLTAGLLRSRVFVALLWVLCALTSFMYFFVRFSIDGNRKALLTVPELSEGQRMLTVAMNSNSILARNFLLALILLTGFVFGMFFYRFFRRDRKTMGCLKALGFRDRGLRRHFVGFAALLSVTGALVGLLAGYFGSGILLAANERSYGVQGLVKGVSVPSLLAGILGPCAVFCLVAFFSYRLVAGREAGRLLSGSAARGGGAGKAVSPMLAIADRMVKVLQKALPRQEKTRSRIKPNSGRLPPGGKSSRCGSPCAGRCRWFCCWRRSWAFPSCSSWPTR